MRITIEAPGNQATELEADRELLKAFGVLHRALIPTRGGGRFADCATAIILARETDALAALAALERAGVRAVPSS